MQAIVDSTGERSCADQLLEAVLVLRQLHELCKLPANRTWRLEELLELRACLEDRARVQVDAASRASQPSNQLLQGTTSPGQLVAEPCGVELCRKQWRREQQDRGQAANAGTRPCGWQPEAKHGCAVGRHCGPIGPSEKRQGHEPEHHQILHGHGCPAISATGCRGSSCPLGATPGVEHRGSRCGQVREDGVGRRAAKGRRRRPQKCEQHPAVRLQCSCQGSAGACCVGRQARQAHGGQRQPPQAPPAAQALGVARP
mmetsp:Transcript_22693/g.71243  ORF Transcript_22693/g.71243 Transcript_22693/m.71243 type:complete len:257 (+) Transcript_22693:106-876(+)